MLDKTKGYFLSEADRKRIDRLDRLQFAPPPAMIAPKVSEYVKAEDVFYALPPCETGIPPALFFYSAGTLFPGVAWCCLFKLVPQDNGIPQLVQLFDAVGVPMRVLVKNAYDRWVNDLVQVYRQRNGDWTNEKPPEEKTTAPAATSSTTTTAGVGTTTQPSLCQGSCLWTATSGLTWNPPIGGCSNSTTTSTTTSTTSTTTTTAGPSTTTTAAPSTTTTTTTAAPCQSSGCRLKCLPVTTTSGPTTAWPPAPSTGYSYQLETPATDGCDAPCSCYGENDPCFVLDAYIESVCVVINTTTSTTTTTRGPISLTDACIEIDLFGGTPLANTYRAASNLGGIGGWMICQDCPTGYKPLYPLGSLEPKLPDPRSRAVYHESPCVLDPCAASLITYPAGKAVFRAFTFADLYANWKNEDTEYEFVRYDNDIENDGVSSDQDDFYLPDEVYAPNWSQCQSCPPGTRPEFPPMHLLPSNTIWFEQGKTDCVDTTPVNGRSDCTNLTDPAGYFAWLYSRGRMDLLPDGMWYWESKCVPAMDCHYCEFKPAWRQMLELDFSNTTTTTMVPPPVTTTKGPTTKPIGTTTAAPCGCVPPNFCPIDVNSCVRTECIPGGATARPKPQCPSTTNTTTGGPGYWCWDGSKMCNCLSSTTTPTPATTATTTTYGCGSSLCSWVYGLNGWVRTGYCADPACLCASYPSAPMPICGSTYTSACLKPNTTRPPSVPCDCLGTCVWIATGIPGSLGWAKISGLCSHQFVGGGACNTFPPGAIGCGCCPPAQPPVDICDIVETGCGFQNCPCNGCPPATTTTGPGGCSCCSTAPCGQSCVFQGKSNGGWTKISDPCPSTCPCPISPYAPAKDECDRIEYKCGSVVPTTTAGTSTTTTTTATTPIPGACCLPQSAENPIGLCQAPMSEIACLSIGGTFMGPATDCDPYPCPTYTTTTTTTGGPGACCFDTLAGTSAWCVYSYKPYCDANGGRFNPGVNCGSPSVACGTTTPAPSTAPPSTTTTTAGPTTTTTTTTAGPVTGCCRYCVAGVYFCQTGKTSGECASLGSSSGAYLWTAGPCDCVGNAGLVCPEV